MTTHDLKVHPEYFAALADGTKPFEARKDDRDPPYAVGDVLRLREWDQEEYTTAYELRISGGATVAEAQAFGASNAYTGRVIERRVSYVLRGGPWLAEGYVVLGLELNVEAKMRARFERLMTRPVSKDLEDATRALFRCSEAHDKLEAAAEALRLALQELVYLHDERPADYEARKAAAWDAARAALAAAPVGRYVKEGA